MFNLHRFLVDYDIAMLRALAQVRGVELTSNRQSEAADQLSAALLQPLSVRAALAQLSPQGQRALEALLSAGGRMRAPQFARRFGQVRPIGPGRLEREAPWQEPANPAEELWYAGLLFRAFHEDEHGPGEFVFIPDDLKPLLPQPQAESPAFAVATVAVPAREGDDGREIVQDLFAYLVYLQTHDVRPYADGRLGRGDLAALRQRLAEPGERRLALLRHLAGQMGLVIREEEYLRLATPPVKRWLTATPGSQLAALQTAWRDDPTWNDLCQVPSLECDQQTPWQNDPVATRRALLSLLAHCPLDEGWTLASFVAAVKEAHPDFQRPDGDYASWYIRDAASGDYLSGFESWDQVEGALLSDLLTGPLHWLGMVATSTSEAGPICCVTEAGARFLDLAPEAAEPPPSPPIILHPDLRIEVPAPASLYVRFQLERFADLENQDPCVYRLTASGLGRTLARGARVEQVLAFLRQASDGRVPANVAGQLQIWAGRFGQARLEEVALLTVKSERALKELSVLPETRSLIGRVLTPTTALIPKKNLPRLRKVLRELGYLLPEDAMGDSPERG